ncbi:MAG TPA: hypothetical protein VFL57_08985, partial [Bryobacteraceae bacterium]|nr:hypothetical protein [Bryobacteraceae bacterium]
MPVLLGVVTLAYAQPGGSSKDAMIARAKSLELNTPYVPPPGDPLVHHAAGYAKVVCSAVFLSGFDPEFAAENLGYFVAPYAERRRLSKPVIDRTAKTVHIDVPNGIRRSAQYLGDQGCVTLPLGSKSVHFRPVKVTRLPRPATQPWPVGDAPARRSLPSRVDTTKVARAVEAAFEPPEAMTAAFVVTWKGHIIGERYGEHVRMDTPLESWSMGKSV